MQLAHSLDGWRSYFRQPILPSSLTFVLLFFNVVLSPGWVLPARPPAREQRRSVKDRLCTFWRAACAGFGAAKRQQACMRVCMEASKAVRPGGSPGVSARLLPRAPPLRRGLITAFLTLWGMDSNAMAIFRGGCASEWGGGWRGTAGPVHVFCHKSFWVCSLARALLCVHEHQLRIWERLHQNW